jgi:hypothetical protein
MTRLFDHLSLGVNDLARSKRFYDAALAPLGVVGRETIAGEIGYSLLGTDPVAPNAQAFFIGFERPGAKRVVNPIRGLSCRLPRSFTCRGRCVSCGGAPRRWHGQWRARTEAAISHELLWSVRARPRRPSRGGRLFRRRRGELTREREGDRGWQSANAVGAIERLPANPALDRGRLTAGQVHGPQAADASARPLHFPDS